MTYRRWIKLLAALFILALLIPASPGARAEADLINSLSFTGYLTPAVGEDPADNLAHITVNPDDADKYSIEEVKWTISYIAYDPKVWPETTSPFTSGREYQLRILVCTQNGYRLPASAAGLRVSLNHALRSQIDLVPIGSGDSVTAAYLLIRGLYVDESLITEVCLDNFDPPILGDTQESHLQLTVPAGAHYYIYSQPNETYYCWKQAREGTTRPFYRFEGRFTSPQLYLLDVLLVPNTNYHFRDDVRVRVNGELWPENLTVAQKGKDFLELYYGPWPARERVSINAVNFPDMYFRSFVSENYDTNGNGTLEYAEYQHVTNILITDLNYMTNMKGIEYFTELRMLQCQNNTLLSLDVSALKKLEILNCSNNNLGTLNVSGLTNLQTLMCADNRLLTLDLSDNPELTTLRCGGSTMELTALDVSHNTKLNILDIRDLHYLNEVDVSACPLLVNAAETAADMTLDENNTIYRAAPPATAQINFYNGTEIISGDGLEISGARFPDSVFRAYVKEHFDTDGDNRLSGSEIAGARIVDYSNSTKISTLRGIEYLTELRRINVPNQNILQLDVSGNTKLEYLACYNNRLTSLELGDLPALWYLDCNSNNLSELDVYGCPALTDLSVRYNSLTSLDIMWNPLLECLYADNNPITSIDVYSCPNLDYLWIEYTDITTLDVSNNPILQGHIGDGERDVDSDGCVYYDGDYVMMDDDVTITGVTLIPIDSAHFPDPDFRRVLQGYGWDENGDGFFGPGELSRIDEMEITGENIHSVEGIGYFTSLDYLNLESNPISALDIRPLVNLSWLTIDDMPQLTTLITPETYDEGLTPVTTLVTGDNGLNWSYLREFSKLESLSLAMLGAPLDIGDIDRNLARDIDKLELYGTTITGGVLNLRETDHLSFLESLDVRWCGLERLFVGQNYLENLDASHNDLVQVYIGGCPLSYAYTDGTATGTNVRYYQAYGLKLVVDSDVLVVADSGEDYWYSEDGLRLPTNLARIEAGAFEGSAAAIVETDKDSLRYIGSRAFANCPGLLYIRIDPREDYVTIADDAFAGSPNVAIVGGIDNPYRLQVLEYAYTHGIPFIG